MPKKLLDKLVIECCENVNENEIISVILNDYGILAVLVQYRLYYLSWLFPFTMDS